jgi:hypothetical protein
LRVGEQLQPGTPFAEVASLESWEAQIDLNEKKIGLVEKKLAKGDPVAVSFVLYSQSSHTFRGQLVKHEQISSQAVAREKENVFLVSLKNIDVPPQLKNALRPGLTGRGKIELGRRPLIAIWTAAHLELVCDAHDWPEPSQLHDSLLLPSRCRPQRPSTRCC